MTPMASGLDRVRLILLRVGVTTGIITPVEVSRHDCPSCVTRTYRAPMLGRDSIISALHWGPLPEADGFYKTSGQHQVRRTDYTSAFHTFGVEWSEDYLFTYIDSRLLVRK